MAGMTQKKLKRLLVLKKISEIGQIFYSNKYQKQKKIIIINRCINEDNRK